MSTDEIGKFNRFSFNYQKENDYEAHYFLWNDPEQNIRMMFRYILLKTPEQQTSRAEIWGTFWDDNDQNNTFGIVDRYPLDCSIISLEKSELKIKNSGMNNKSVWGEVSANGKVLRWYFDINSSNAININRLPGLEALDFFPNFASDFCSCTLSGRVEVNDTHYEIKDIKSSDGHYTNLKNLHSWNWGNCVNFKEYPDFVFEGISVRYNNWSTPALWLFFYWKGKLYSTDIASSMYINQENVSELDRWVFTAEIDSIRFECELSGKPEDMILLTHPLPDDSNLYTTITLAADLKIDIFEKENSDWKKIDTVTADKTATFEVTKLIRNKAVINEFIFNQN